MAPGPLVRLWAELVLAKRQQWNSVFAQDSEKLSCSIGHPPGSGPDDVAKENLLEVIKRKRSQVPLEMFHLRYLSVTDISAQVWCEQQIVYRREHPNLLLPENTALLDTGKSIHLARELEDHDLVMVHTTSQEDSWAIKVLNLLIMLRILQAGHRVREFPVFGVLEDIFVVGIIDQLGYTAKGELELNELKTRNQASMPSASQKKRDYFQVFLYKYIFDAMMRGCLTSDSFIHHLCLRPEQPLGPHVQEQAQRAGFTVGCFHDLLELLFLNLLLLEIPPIDRLQIEYIHQETGTPLGTEVLAYDQNDVRAKVQYFLAYWKGQRDPEGVDVEDAWKCRYCAYSNVCVWRMGESRKPSRKVERVQVKE
ncbi:exonuclease V isoform X2 [Rhineura floridana]|uniref:exonuclease V isoform X2 n=1 Tax=Rhineura floridana TaxID=261503 RepID=UPI002AC846E4|nr:exonuclease V isoform X2 [Rhineura floridana]